MEALGYFILSLGIIGILCVFIWSLVWVYRDAKKRGQRASLVVLLVALMNWPVSILLWLVIRPGDVFISREV